MKCWHLKICLALGSTVFALLVAELTVRFLDLPPHPLKPIRSTALRISDNPVLIYDYHPSLPSQKKSSSYHNLEGFKDRERTETKPAGVRRILCLGDSTTAGNGVKDVSARFSELLERNLNANPHRTAEYEVFNMGVSGYQTVQEVETLRTKGLKYDPDLVLLTVCLNDFKLGNAVLDCIQEGTRRKIQSQNSFGSTLLRKSRFAFVVYHRLLKTQSNLEKEYIETHLEGECPVERGMRQLAELQQQHGFKTHVVVLPMFVHAAKSYGETNFTEHEKVQSIVSQYPNLPLTDLQKQFYSLPEHASHYACDRLHLNERGHLEMCHMLLPIVRSAFREEMAPDQTHEQTIPVLSGELPAKQ